MVQGASFWHGSGWHALAARKWKKKKKMHHATSFAQTVQKTSLKIPRICQVNASQFSVLNVTFIGYLIIFWMLKPKGEKYDIFIWSISVFMDCQCALLNIPRNNLNERSQLLQIQLLETLFAVPTALYTQTSQSSPASLVVEWLRRLH